MQVVITKAVGETKDRAHVMGVRPSKEPDLYHLHPPGHDRRKVRKFQSHLGTTCDFWPHFTVHTIIFPSELLKRSSTSYNCLFNCSAIYVTPAFPLPSRSHGILEIRVEKMGTNASEGVTRYEYLRRRV